MLRTHRPSTFLSRALFLAALVTVQANLWMEETRYRNALLTATYSICRKDLQHRRPGSSRKTITDTMECSLLATVKDNPHTIVTSIHHRIQGMQLVGGMWPPWPFTTLQNRQRQTQDTASEGDHYAQSRASHAWKVIHQSTRVGFKNMQTLASQLWFHLPPAAPPFLLLAAWPRAVIRDTGVATGTATTQWNIPLFSNPFCRNMALSGIGLALISWGHYELHRKRKLTPMQLPVLDVNSAMLPPFLPDALAVYHPKTTTPTSTTRTITTGEINHNEEDNDRNDDDIDDHRHLHIPDILSNTSQWQRACKNWIRSRQLRQVERQNAQRLQVFDELLQLQQQRRRQRRPSPATTGYALVTGASRGIGRALAVELARWEIPLILVARDQELLTSLAYDIEACYGVKVCVLPADLSKPGAAESIYRTTQQAGIAVDYLINNAGVSSHGLTVDLSPRELNDMLQVNAMSVATLTHLYGKEMKERRRGRIMMMSSVCGAVTGLPSVALYSATKAFENSMALGMAKEMEPHGVGVTCIMPGAVRDTDFRAKSNSAEALCWKLPFYSKTSQEVASWSVRAMLRGDTEATLGWQNRVFLKVIKPIIPQRLHNMIAEFAWNPIRLPFWSQIDSDDSESTLMYPVRPPVATLRPRYGYKSAPRLLKIVTEEKEPPKPEPRGKGPSLFGMPMDRPHEKTAARVEPMDGAEKVDDPSREKESEDVYAEEEVSQDELYFEAEAQDEVEDVADHLEQVPVETPVPPVASEVKTPPIKEAAPPSDDIKPPKRLTLKTITELKSSLLVPPLNAHPFEGS